MKYLGWLGMVLSVVSYFLTVNGLPFIGVPLAATGCMVYAWYSFRLKIWNFLALQAVFFAVNLTGMYHLWK